jgi:hypothetical protein
MSECAHNRFAGDVKVTRLTERGRFLAHIEIRCAECQEAFRFTGAERLAAPSIDHPTANLDRTVLRVPIDPKGFIYIRGS